MATIYITVSHERHQATAEAEPFRCPRCRAATTARVGVSWILRRHEGLPMRVSEVRSKWTCASCGEVTSRDGGTSALPPFTHQFGGFLFLGGVLGAIVLGLGIWFAVATAGHGEYAEEQAALRAELAPLNQRAAMTVALGKARVEACTRAVDAAIAKALPDGVAGVKPRPTSALTSAKLVELPVYPAFAHRDGTGWSAKAPRACHLELPFETERRVESGFEPSRDSVSMAQQKLIDYVTAVMKVTTPSEIVFLDGPTASVISIASGELLGFARAVGDDRFSDRVARRLARRSR